MQMLIHRMIDRILTRIFQLRSIIRIDRQRIARTPICRTRECIAGSDCGYGTWGRQAAVDPDVVFAKLGAMAEGCADRVEAIWK